VNNSKNNFTCTKPNQMNNNKNLTSFKTFFYHNVIISYTSMSIYECERECDERQWTVDEDDNEVIVFCLKTIKFIVDTSSREC
jgi:hypothetical protein